MMKRKRVVLSIEQKLEIVQKSENGTNVKTLVKEYNVGDSTVRDIIKNGPKFIEFSDVSEGGKSYMSGRKTMKTSTYDDLDKAMFTWFSQQKARGCAVSDAVSVAKAKYFFDILKLKGDFNASSGWLRRFKHRHGIDQMPIKDEKSTFTDSAADECSDQFDLSLGAEDLTPEIIKLDVDSIKSENLSDNEFIAEYRIPKEFIAQFQMIFKIKEYVPKAGIPAIVYLRDGKKYAGIELENVSEPEVFEYKVNILDDDIKSENCDASSNKSTDDKYFCDDDDDDFYLSEDSSNRTTQPGKAIKLQRLFQILPKKKKKIKGRIHSKIKDENRKKIPKLKVKCISSKKKYDRSLKINNSFIEFNCHLCPEEFDIWETLEKHTQEIHSTKPKISCLCDKFLRSKKTVYSHILKHDKTIVRHKCEFCKTKFVTEKNYKQHILSFHTSDKNNPSLCDKCEMSFENLYLLKLHSKQHHLQEEKTIFSCDICGDKFSAKGSVQRHIKIVHEKEKNQICHVCGKSYHDKGDLVDHLTKHTNIRAFQCPHCPKNYKTRSSYKKHFDSHNGIKHKCDKCPAEFNLRSTLRQHKYVHDDVCRFVCSVCDKGFKWRRSFKTHMNTHTGDKPFSCPWCPKKFADGPNCRIHKRRNHPIELAEYEAQHGITSRKGIEIINMPEPNRESGEQLETNNMKMIKISQLTSSAIALLT